MISRHARAIVAGGAPRALSTALSRAFARSAPALAPSTRALSTSPAVPSVARPVVGPAPIFPLLYPIRAYASSAPMQAPWPAYEAEGENPFKRPSGLVADRAAITAHIAGSFASDYYASLSVDADGRALITTSSSTADEGSRAPFFSPLIQYLSPAPDGGEAEANRLYRRAVIDATEARDKPAFYRGALIAMARALVKDSPQAKKCPDCQEYLAACVAVLEQYDMNSPEETDNASAQLMSLITLVRDTDQGVVSEVARRLINEGHAEDVATAGNGSFLSTLFGASTAGGVMAATAAPTTVVAAAAPGVAGPPGVFSAVGAYGAQPPAPFPPNVDPNAQPKQPGLGSMLVSGLIFGTVFALVGRLFM